MAEVLIVEKNVHLAVSKWLDLNYPETDSARADMQERLNIAGMEAMNDYGMTIPEFLDVISDMDAERRINIRYIRVTLKNSKSKASSRVVTV